MLVSTKTRRLRHLLRVQLGHDEIGRRIASAREEAGLTQQELAERIGLRSGQSISRYERGETEVPSKKLRRIAEQTHKPLTFFIDDLEAQAEEQDVAELAVVERLERIEAREAQNGELLRELLQLVRGAQEPPPADAEAASW